MDNDLFSIFQEEFQTVQTKLDNLSDDDVKTISQLAHDLSQLDAFMVQLEDLKKNVASRQVYISEVTLPEALAKLGVSKFELSDGSSISMNRTYYPSIKEENVEEAHAWLVEAGHDIIKSNVSVTFTKCESERSRELACRLIELGYTPKKEDSIHWQTFRAWAKDMHTRGEYITDLINVHVVNKAVVKKGKTK